MTEEKVVIAGGGVAGLYTAWRLVNAGHAPASIELLEAGDRVGGRLWSIQMRSDSSLPAELGGMFLNDQQPLVYGLVRQVFDLDLAPVTPAPDFAWLRGKRFSIEQFADPDILPYQLRPDEQGLSYHALTLLAIERMAPEIKQYWPFNPAGSREQSLAYLRNHRFEGRLLCDWGFWNLMARVISNEAWQALRDVVSTYTLFANWNALDAIVSIVLEQAGKWYRLAHGYQQLPERLAAALREAGVKINLSSPLHLVQRLSRRTGPAFSLEVGVGPDARQIQADRLVLALPLMPIVKLVNRSPDLQSSPLAAQLKSIRALPACKIFLTFDQPWWRDVPDGPGKIQPDTYGVSHTDLPMRQCYYLGVDEASGQGLVMASYADGTAVDFWRALADDNGHAGKLESTLSRRAITEIQSELSEMHGVEVPPPTGGLFIDWAKAPFGGGWHNWQPGYKSWEIAPLMARPDPALPLHVCGEAFSEAQGWTEGALGSAETMLQKEFGLKAPAWLNDSAGSPPPN